MSGTYTCFEKFVLKFLPRNLNLRDRFGYVGMEGRVITKWILRQWDARIMTGFTWLKIVSSGVSVNRL
jgi:hypothetical protein